MPQADLYLQDEVQFAFHPTLTRLRSRKGRRGQRLVEAPGDNRKVYGFGLVDWRDGWFDWPCPGLTRRGLRIDSSSYWLVCCAYRFSSIVKWLAHFQRMVRIAEGLFEGMQTPIAGIVR